MFVYFEAILGNQANQEFYTVHVPFSAMSKSFVFEDSELPTEMRGQRELDIRRSKKFKEYMQQNGDSFVTGAVIGAINNDVSFIPFEGGVSSGKIGMLRIPLDMKITLCDGQHRHAGINELMSENPEMAENDLPIVLYRAEQVDRRQQIFSDINGHTIKPSSSLSMTFNHRNAFINFIKDIAEQAPGIKPLIEYEKNSVGANSLKLWPLVSFKKFVCYLINMTEKAFDRSLESEESQAKVKSIVVEFIKGLDHLPMWTEVMNRKLSVQEVRQDYIVSHAVFLEALGVWGANLFASFEAQGAVNWSQMESLSNLNLLKENWVGRCVSPQFTMVKSTFGVKSTAAKLCQLTNIPLSPDLQKIEDTIEQTPHQKGLKLVS